MVRNRKHQKIDMAKMYRHFAVVTVAVTALVGLFADGEATQAVEDHMQERAERERIAKAEKEREADKQLIRRDHYAGGGGGSFDSGMALAGISAGTATSDSSNFIQLPPGEKDETTVWGRLGISREDWFSLPSDVRKALAGTNDPMIIGTAEERREAMRRASAASRSRARPDTSVAGNAIVLDEETDY